MTSPSELKTNDLRSFAFPQEIEHIGGLTKRELFAAMAMQGLCASVREYGPGRFIGVYELASDSVACADALLTALDVSK